MVKLRNIAAEEEAKQFLEGASQDDLIALYLDWKKVDGHFSAELKAVENDHGRITTLKSTNATLLEALQMFLFIRDQSEAEGWADAYIEEVTDEAYISADKAIRKATT